PTRLISLRFPVPREILIIPSSMPISVMPRLCDGFSRPIAPMQSCIWLLSLMLIARLMVLAILSRQMLSELSVSWKRLAAIGLLCRLRKNLSSVFFIFPLMKFSALLEMKDFSQKQHPTLRIRPTLPVKLPLIIWSGLGVRPMACQPS
ncbi:unnamed protein product, partial [Pararhodospirillum photometricum DSM 122]